MDLWTFKRIVEQDVTYKPGWRFHFLVGYQTEQMHAFQCRMIQVDSTEEVPFAAGQLIEALSTPAERDQLADLFKVMTVRFFVSTAQVDGFDSKFAALKYIQSLLIEIERHEVDEWFKCVGEHFNRPHTEAEIMIEAMRKEKRKTLRVQK